MANRLALLLVVIFLTIIGYSQQYNFINYSIEDGLAQSQIRSICQDDGGYIWIGTYGGVSKFDGTNFYNYSINDGLLGNQVNSIYKDNRGKLWFGSLGGVSYLTNNNFNQLFFKEQYKNRYVSSIAQNNNNDLFFGTDGGGVVKYQNNQLYYIDTSNGLPHNYVRHLYFDNNNLWVSTSNGAALITPQQKIIDTLKGKIVSQIHNDSLLFIYSTLGDGITIVKDGVEKKYTIENGLVSSHIRSFYLAKNNKLWCASKRGLSLINLNKGEIKNYREKDGLPNGNIRCVIQDNYQNLFFGTDGSGLVKFTGERFVSYTTQDGLSSDIVMNISQDKDSSLWFSTYGSGLIHFKHGEYKFYTINNGLPNNTIWTSLIDASNQKWFGTSKGLSKLAGNKFININEKDGLKGNKVYSIIEDKSNNIWVGTKEGVSIIDGNTNQVIRSSVIENTYKNIRSIRQKGNYIWLTSDNGLLKYNLQDSSYKVFSAQDGLPDNSVMCVEFDQNGVLWVGTKNGLVFFKDKKFHTIQLDNNYGSNGINFLKIDKINCLWVGTNYGVFKLSIDDYNFSEKKIIHFTNYDGLKSLECNQNAVEIDYNNNLWLGTSKGLMLFNLNNPDYKQYLPQLHITGIRLFFQKHSFKNRYSSISPETGLPNNLTLKYKENHLTFDYIGINHANPDKVKYSFMLEGFDDGWSPINQDRFVTYSNLPYGEYVFKLKASTDGFVWSKPIQFSFTILPPFWLTWWFLLISFIVFIIFTYIIYYVRKQLKLKKQQTQRIIDQSKILNLEHQSLNASMNRHFIFNALNSIQYYINTQDKLSANKYLSSFAKLIRKNLDSSLVNEVLLNEEIERIKLYLELEQMRFKDKFTYQINVDENLLLQQIKIPAMLLQPFIENSIWHGILPLNKTGHINLEVKKIENKIIFIIKDNGVGIDTSIESKKHKKNQHISKGMELTKGRINLISKLSHKECYIKGPYQINNAQDNSKGTQVEIVISV